MRRGQLIAGVAVFALGVLLMVAGHYTLPKSPTAWTTAPLGGSQNSTLPSETPRHSAAVVPFGGLPTGSSVAGNFTGERGASGTPPLFSAYLLTASQWSNYNRTFTAGEDDPTAFLWGVANESATSWGPVLDPGGTMALLYLGPMDNLSSLNESLSYVAASGGPPHPLSDIPTGVVLKAPSAYPGRSVFGLVGAPSLLVGFGVSVALHTAPNGSAQVFAFSSNDSRSCPPGTFLPTLPSCWGNFWAGPVLTNASPVASWFTPVHGNGSGWSVVVLSWFSGPTVVSLNESATTTSTALSLTPSNVVVAVGAGLGFFGFLGLTGALVSQPRSDDEEEDSLVPPEPEPAKPEGTVPIRLKLSADGVQWVGGEARVVAPPTPGAAGSSQLTCGVCGTGYSIRHLNTGCPVCGSRSVVFQAPSGLTLD